MTFMLHQRRVPANRNLGLITPIDIFGKIQVRDNREIFRGGVSLYLLCLLGIPFLFLEKKILAAL